MEEWAWKRHVQVCSFNLYVEGQVDQWLTPRSDLIKWMSALSFEKFLIKRDFFVGFSNECFGFFGFFLLLKVRGASVWACTILPSPALAGNTRRLSSSSSPLSIHIWNRWGSLIHYHRPPGRALSFVFRGLVHFIGKVCIVSCLATKK